jgi:c-di-GMP-binding flagellar brake protein YcgR
VKERRKFVRIKSDAEIKYKVVKDMNSLTEKEIIMSAKSLDIGGGGICIETSEALKEGTLLALEIKIKKIPHPIFTLGEVVWSKKIGDKYSLGIKFVWIAENDNYKIFNYLIDEIVKD